MKSVCVYLGANLGNSARLREAATTLGQVIATAGYRLVYGGSSQGLMGLLATSAMAHGGKVTGVIPTCLIDKELPSDNLDSLILTESMHERKLIMQQQADAFIVMPGGLGTLEEAFETWTAIKIGILNKPLGFLNIDGFYDELFSFIGNCTQHGFIAPHQMHIPSIDSNPQTLLASLEKHYTAVAPEAVCA
ncbi:MAG: TIGR00730 family Rossman fold protein [Legionellaceae bacterium]|nr:TIGR00730 family Rossman fold protein [Legionellaceae bacterium]